MNGGVGGKPDIVGKIGGERHRRPGDSTQYRIEIIAKKPQKIRIALFINTNNNLVFKKLIFCLWFISSK